MNYETLQIERSLPVAWVWLAREAARNAQNRLMLDELDDAMGALSADPEVRVVVLAARGAHFSAGHNLREGQAERADYTVEQRWAYEELRYFDYCMRIWDYPKPVIAQVQGACISAGFMLANMCDLVVASESAFFSDPVVHTLGAASVEVLIHPWVIGLRQAKEMLYTGGRLDAAEALRIGMVNRVVPNERLADEAMALAQHIAKAPPFALKLIKRSLNRTLDAKGMRAALSAHFDTHQLSHQTTEYGAARQKGLDAALKKQG
jgi:enoyl-CoA hydratase